VCASITPEGNADTAKMGTTSLLERSTAEKNPPVCMWQVAVKIAHTLACRQYLALKVLHSCQCRDECIGFVLQTDDANAHGYAPSALMFSFERNTYFEDTLTPRTRTGLSS
jgi:hypothetical protein